MNAVLRSSLTGGAGTDAVALPKMEFIHLMAQCRARQPGIDGRIREMLEHGADPKEAEHSGVVPALRHSVTQPG